jgi:hypothetical protein
VECRLLDDPGADGFRPGDRCRPAREPTRAEFARCQKLYYAEDERVSWARHRGIAAPPINPTVAMNYNAAFLAVERARTTYEATNAGE